MIITNNSNIINPAMNEVEFGAENRFPSGCVLCMHVIIIERNIAGIDRLGIEFIQMGVELKNYHHRETNMIPDTPRINTIFSDTNTHTNNRTLSTHIDDNK